MKIKVIWFDGSTDTAHELVGTKEFPGTYEDVLEAFGEVIQDIVDWYESNHGIIDQGGDDDWMEFDLADYSPSEDDPKLPKILFDRLEEEVG